jgi:hypothetical protein
MGAETDDKGGGIRATAAHQPHALHGVLANEVRHKILMRCGERPYSATELAADLGLSRRKVSDQIEELKKAQPPLLEFVGRKAGKKRGSMRMYKAARFNFSVEDWRTLSPVEQAVSSTNIVTLLTEDLSRGLIDGTLYAHDDHVLLRDRQMVDAQAMTEVRILFDELYDRFVEVVTSATQRMEKSGETPIPLTLALVSAEVAPKGG